MAEFDKLTMVEIFQYILNSESADSYPRLQKYKS